MPEFTYAVTQNVHYYSGVDMDEPSDIVDLFENGEWDDGKNEVKWERVQVYDLDGKLVYDTGGAEVVTIWTVTVATPDSRYTYTSAHGSEDEANAFVRENHDPEGECVDSTIEELAAYFNLDLTVASHAVTLP